MSSKASSKTCNCERVFLTVKNHIEANYAGFNDKVNNSTRKNYKEFSEKILAMSRNQVEKSSYCVYLLNEWISFFKDRHIQIRSSTDASQYQISKSKIDEEIVPLSKKQLEQLKSSKGIEGLYKSKDGSFEIAIIENVNSFRKYIGVILSSTSRFWVKGQVILELKQISNSELIGIHYSENRTPKTVVLNLKNNLIGDWVKCNYQEPKKKELISSEKKIWSKLLSEETLYVKIGSFNQRNSKEIELLFNGENSLVKRVPNLIIDIRDNGGGADFSYEAILPYLYTKPIKVIGADVLSTKANISGWAKLLNMEDIPKDELSLISDYIRRMKQNEGKLISIIDDEIISFEKPALYPKKIGILINSRCASTAEQFLLACKQSDKIVLFGEGTSGVLDYANMRTFDINLDNYTLFYATSRSRRLNVKQGIDNIGINPDIFLTNKQDWIKEALFYLEEK